MARPNLADQTRPRIVAAALELLDRDGLERLSTRRLADHLGISGPTLYHYFSSKEKLLEAVAHHLSAEIWASVRAEVEALPGDDVEGFVRAYAHGALAAFSRHPRAVEHLALRPVTGRTTLEGYELVLARLTDAGCTIELAWQVMLALENLVLAGALEASAPPFAPSDELAAELPHVAAVGRVVAADPTLDRAFEFGLDAIVAALHAHLRRTP